MADRNIWFDEAQRILVAASGVRPKIRGVDPFLDERLNQLLTDIRAAFADAKIYLFGSRATGRARPDSDYDLIVISGHFQKTPFIDRAAEIWRRSDAPIGADLLCYTPDEFSQVSKTSTVIKDALKDAILV